MPNVDDVHDIVSSVLNDSDPVNVLNDDSDDDVSNVMNLEQSELHSSASDIADTELQLEYDLGNLFDESETPIIIINNNNLRVSSFQCYPMEAWRRVPNSSSCNVVTGRLTSSFLWHK